MSTQKTKVMVDLEVLENLSDLITLMFEILSTKSLTKTDVKRMKEAARLMSECNDLMGGTDNPLSKFTKN